VVPRELPQGGSDGEAETKPDFSIGKKKYAAELIPPALVIARYYPKDQAAIEALEAEVAAVEQELEEIAEEHCGEDEIKTLVVDDKWLATLAAAVQEELDRVSQTLTGRIRLLADRYASPLPQLTDEVAQLAAKVAAHLEKMGVKA
jgi:type I restriction enzyme M protein